MYKRNRGLTLIALVITIIVLLILAGITIGLLLNQNGIFKKAQMSKIMTELGEIEEKFQLVVLNCRINELSEEQLISPVEKELTKQNYDLLDEKLKVVITEKRKQLGIEDFQQIYYLDDEKVGGGKRSYLYDNKVGSIYKVQGVTIGNNTIFGTQKEGIKGCSCCSKTEDPRLNFIKNGILNEEKTGPWTKYSNAPYANRFEYDDSIKAMQLVTSGPGTTAVYTENQIDVSNYSKLILTAKMSTDGGNTTNNTYIGLSDKKEGLDANFIISAGESTQSTQEQDKTITLDISDLEGSYYIKLLQYHQSPNWFTSFTYIFDFYLLK